MHHETLDFPLCARFHWKKCSVCRWFQDAPLTQAARFSAMAQMNAKLFRSGGQTNPISIVPNNVEVPNHLSVKPQAR